MLEPDFDNINLNSTHNSKTKARVEYSGGFRQLSLSHIQRDNKDAENRQDFKQKSPHVLDYVQRLGIENLPSLYLESMPDNSNLLFEKKKQEQQQSVVRLYRNLYPGRKSRTIEQSDSEQGSPNKKYATDIWEKDKKFQQLPNQFIISREIESIDRKIQIEFEGVLKKKKIQNQLKIHQAFSLFIILQKQQILQVLHKQCKTSVELELVYLWKGFLNKVNLSKLLARNPKETIEYDNIDGLRKSSKYLFSLIILPPLKQNETGQKLYNFKELSTLMSKQLKFEMKQIKELFQTQKSYTNPLKIQEQARQKKKNKMQQVLEQVDTEQEKNKFKANPVPKSTYQQPKKKEKREAKATSVQQFKLTEKQQYMTPEQFYQFEKHRDFKAQPVPESTYKPFKPALLSEEEKKARAIMTLQKSKYPQNMKMLQNYNEHIRRKAEQLTHKYEKSVEKISIKQIPDFNHLHAKELVNLETTKQKNNKVIKIQPFKLSEGRGRPQPVQNSHFGVPIIHPYSPPKPGKQVKSTKKFDTYVKFRNEWSKQKARKESEKEKKAEIKQKKRQPYRNIIKSRMAEEFEKHPKISNQFDASMPARIAVDRTKIYQERPLLMQSSLPAHEYELGWDPIF